MSSYCRHTTAESNPEQNRIQWGTTELPLDTEPSPKPRNWRQSSICDSPETEKNSARAYLVRFNPDSDSWADIPRSAASCHSTKSLRDSGGCGLGLSSVPRDSRGDCLEHALPMHPSHTSRTATSLKTKIIKSRKRGHTREHDDCLDEQIKNSPARPIETFEVQINRYAVAHPNVIGQFITQKLPIALSCHAQLVEMMDGTKREFPI